MYMEKYIKNLVFVLVMSFVCIVNGRTMIQVGVILDNESSFGKMIKTCISMAIDDFYQQHENYTTMIQPHFRNSKQDNVEAAFAAISLLEDVQVAAILGPMRSSQADFVIAIGNKSRVPIISPATSPSLSPNDNLYFVRSAHNSSSQLEPLAKLIKHFGWREVVFVYEDDEYGRGLLPYLSDSMLTIDAKVMSRTLIHPSASDYWILRKLYKLKTMQTRVFVVHALPDLASRFFKKVKEAGMMEEGYVWIITDVLISRLHSLDIKDIELMQGVVGLKSYIPRTKKYINFDKRWKREMRKRNSEDGVAELDMFGIWSYDTVFALALALEKAGNNINTSFVRQRKSKTDMYAIRTSEMGPSLLPRIRNLKFKGLSGTFHVLDGQLQSSVYEIVNIIGKSEKTIGYWTPKNGLSKEFKLTPTNQKNDLGAITWPGKSDLVPKGWELPTSNENKLRVGVPAKGGFPQFINVNIDPQTQHVNATGFCVDVFNAVIGALPYAIKHEFIPFATPDGKEAGNYNDLIHNLSIGKYDAVAGDITILATRADYVDFTLPYTESGVSIIVPIKDERKSAWIFLKPLEKDLWLTIGGFFIYTGIVVWILERRVNKEFRGAPHQQIGMIFWFSFSTLVYAHREKLISNLSRFVVIVWVFVVLVLTSSYTASLTSMLTVQQLQPAYTDINQILRNGESVGYQDGSFVYDMLIKMGFDDSKVKSYMSFEEYDTALQLGSKSGGVSAIMDELPYFRVFLSSYCAKYTMTGPTYKSAGLGFAFPKGSPLVHDVSRAVLQVTEEQMTNISKQWFEESASCDQQKGATVTKNILTLKSFQGLFLIAGFSSSFALVLFFLTFLYQNREMLLSQSSIRQKLVAIAKAINMFKDDESKKTNAEVAGDDFVGEPATPINEPIQESGALSLDKGFSTTEPGTPVNEPIQVTETTTET